MIERRDVMRGGLAAGVAALAAAPKTAASLEDDSQSAAAINRLRESVERQFDAVYTGKWRGVLRVRQQQRTWLQATHKYPDFIEIGIDVWDNLFDWHVTFQQPFNVTRLADGRYAATFMFTTLLLRSDQSPDYVGFPFEAEGRNRP
jgi:hypothetical protein